MTHSAKLTETHRHGLFLVPSSLSWLEIVPLDLEPVRRWEEMGGVSFREGRGGGERFDFDGSLHRSTSPVRVVANSSCSHSPGNFYYFFPINAGFLLCIKHPFVVKQNAPKNSWQKTFRKWERWFIMQLTHQCTQTNKKKSENRLIKHTGISHMAACLL